ncbi:MAG: hypothetical protein JO206_01500, partial [Solirubrobacterales bacterium]|nr:hypothetical protein [Solirubrobacterales bacterium]
MSLDTGSIRDELRRVLLTPGEAMSVEVPGRTEAAVLVTLFVSDGQLHSVFTERRHDLRR